MFIASTTSCGLAPLTIIFPVHVTEPPVVAPAGSVKLAGAFINLLSTATKAAVLSAVLFIFSLSFISCSLSLPKIAPTSPPKIDPIGPANDPKSGVSHSVPAAPPREVPIFTAFVSFPSEPAKAPPAIPPSI